MSLTDTLARIFALPITRQLARLNDNLEAVMSFYGIPNAEQQRESRKLPVQVLEYDEEVAAIEEFIAAHRPAPPADEAK